MSDARPPISGPCIGSRAGVSMQCLPCGARSLPFGRPVQTAPALRRQCTAGEHGAGPLAAGATQPGGKPAASQLGRPPSRGVHARLAPSALPARWEARRAIYAPPFPLESPPTFDVVLPMAELTSLADGQSRRGRTLLTRLTQPARPGRFAGFPQTRTVPQTDTVPADAPLAVEVTKSPPTAAAAAEFRRWLCRGWRRRPVNQFIPAVPDGLIAVHAGRWCCAVLAASHRLRPPASCRRHRTSRYTSFRGQRRRLRSSMQPPGLRFARGFRCVVWSQPDLRARSFVLRPRLLVIGARLDECPLCREKRQPCLDDPVQLPCFIPVSRGSCAPASYHRRGRSTAGRSPYTTDPLRPGTPRASRASRAAVVRASRPNQNERV